MAAAKLNLAGHFMVKVHNPSKKVATVMLMRVPPNVKCISLKKSLPDDEFPYLLKVTGLALPTTYQFKTEEQLLMFVHEAFVLQPHCTFKIHECVSLDTCESFLTACQKMSKMIAFIPVFEVAVEMRNKLNTFCHYFLRCNFFFFLF